METMTSLQERNFETLRGAIRGTVATPGDAAYDEARKSWNLVIDHRPEAIVVAADEQDVQAAVRFAAKVGMPVAVQSTGHGQFRPSTSGMLIVTSALNSVTIDPEARTAQIGAGAVWRDVIQAAGPHGLAPLSGSSPIVGVIGYLLGGGINLMVRKYGLAVDHVRRFRVVVPDGSIVTATPTENADLFWALCGGGGAFGVITEVEIALFPHAEVYGGSLLFPAERASEVYRAYLEWTQGLSEDVSSGLILITFPPVPFVPEFLQGRSMVILAVCIPAGPEAEAALQPMRALGPEFDFVETMPFTESARIYNDPVDPLPALGAGVLLKPLDERAIETMLAAIGEPAQSPNLMIQLRHLGGAIPRAAQQSAADRVREAEFLIYMLGVPHPGNAPAAISAHSSAVFDAIAPWVLGKGPLNFLGEADVTADAIREAVGEEGHTRLQVLKRTLDPDNRFRHAGIGIQD